MLVLSRRLNEAIVLPGIETSIRVQAIKGDVVRLGIEAPREVTILREEVPDQAAGWGPIGTLPPGPITEAKLRQLNHLLQTRLNSAEETIRVLTEEVQSLRQRANREGESGGVASPARSRKALLVEDEHNERELLAGFLRMAGLDVDTACDGADALDYLRDHERPDVVLLDMGLPGCDGPTLVREIRRNAALAKLKIFAVTGYSPQEFHFGSSATGVDRWFQKPLDPDVLLQGLDQALACVCAASS